MILIVDSGSTKADFVAVSPNGHQLFATQTLGLNPEVLTSEQIIARLDENQQLSQEKSTILAIYFYGAGCGTDRMKLHLTTVLQTYFDKAKVSVLEDTYAAAYATYTPGENSIICILGTGSNCSYFDGKTLHQKVQSLGYIAMDDASGNRFGRELIRAYYFGVMPKELASEFEKQYDLDADVVKENFYKKPNPNAYLAQFARFLIENKKHPFLQEMIAREIEQFVRYYIQQFSDYNSVKVHFVGSVAFHLKEEIKQVLDKHQIQLGKVLAKPMDGLMEYHSKNN